MILGANVIWGLAPLLYKELAHIPPIEVTSHRIVWSFAFFGLVLAAQGRLSAVFRIFSKWATARMVLFATAMISFNWFLFIWAIQSELTLQASLGYFIFPLISVLLGVVFYGEGMPRLKLLAVAIAASAVLVLTLGLGAPPWISLILATTFGIYSILKKRTELGPTVSVTAEVLIVAPFALIWILGVHNQLWNDALGGGGGAFGKNSFDTVLLMLSGPLTALPLILFSFAARRLSMATVGLMQYTNPTIQFLVAAFIFAEPFTRWHGIAFPMIWVALAIYTLHAYRQERSARIVAKRDGRSVAT